MFYSYPDHWAPFRLPDNLANRGSLGFLAPFWLLTQSVRFRERTWKIVGSLTGFQLVSYQAYDHSVRSLARGICDALVAV